MCVYSYLTCKLYLHPPKLDSQLPISAHGPRYPCNRFRICYRHPLTADRSDTLGRILTPMTSVNAVSTIIEDVRFFERCPQRERSDVDLDVDRSLRKKGHAKHSDLVAASKLWDVHC